MFILKVKKKGMDVSQLSICDEREFFIGRSEDSDVVLSADHGISRKHLKIFKEDEVWKVQCVSQLGGLAAGGEPVQEMLLNSGDVFYLGEYSFHWTSEEPSDDFSDKKAEELALMEEDSSSQNTSEENQKEEGEELALAEEENSQKKETSDDLDPTQVTRIAAQLKPYLVISLSEDEEDQSVHLEGNKWVVGRDPANDICIEVSDVSRQHFEIRKRQNQFFIQDLNSANCTYLDDQRLDPQREYLLESGSTIRILDIEIYFEIRNPRAKEKIAPSLAPVPLHSAGPNIPQPYTAAPPSVIADETIMTAPPPIESSSKKKRILIIVSIFSVVGLALFFMSDQNKTDKDTPQSSELSANEAFNVLSDDLKEQVKDTYSLAQQLYHQKKYELCYEKLNSLHEIVPFYEESESLIMTCKNGADSIRAQMEIEQRNKQAEQNKKIIADNVKKCKKQLAGFSSVEELEQCLSPAIEIDPENSEVSFLLSEFETQQILKQERLNQKRAYQKRVAGEMKIYGKAKQLKESGKILSAISAYKDFLKRKRPKGMEEAAAQAQEELNTMETELNTKINQAMKDCSGLMEQKQYKSAHKACKDVLDIFPGHSEARKKAEQAVTAINKALKPLFEEGALNESLGQIDMAKKYWKQIVEQDIPGGHYATKAEIKLKKY